MSKDRDNLESFDNSMRSDIHQEHLNRSQRQSERISKAPFKMVLQEVGILLIFLAAVGFIVFYFLD